MVLSGLGDVLTDLGGFDEAEECYEASLSILDESGDVSAQIAVSNNMGRMWDEADELEQALECYQKSLELAHTQGDLHSAAAALENLATVLQYQDRLNEARAAHEQSLAIHRQRGDRHSESMILNNLGNLHRKMRDFEQAEDYFQKALDIKRELDDKPGLGSVLVNLAILRWVQERWGDIRPLVEEVVKMGRRLIPDDTLATTYALLGLVCIAEDGDFTSGKQHCVQAVMMAWGHNLVAGHRINRFILSIIQYLADSDQAELARILCEHIVEVIQEQIARLSLEALSEFAAIMDELIKGHEKHASVFQRKV
jgi:tetratricopeptide (TPR) repeat protein